MQPDEAGAEGTSRSEEMAARIGMAVLLGFAAK